MSDHSIDFELPVAKKARVDEHVNFLCLDVLLRVLIYCDPSGDCHRFSKAVGITPTEKFYHQQDSEHMLDWARKQMAYHRMLYSGYLSLLAGIHRRSTILATRAREVEEMTTAVLSSIAVFVTASGSTAPSSAFLY